MIRLPERRAELRAQGSSLDGMREALRYVRETPPLPALLAMALAFSILGIPVITLLPVVARDLLGVGADGYGTLMACLGFGAMLGALAIAATGGGTERGRVMRTASFVFPVVLLVFPLLAHPTFAGLALIVAGTAMIVNNALVNARLQDVVPDALRGRVMALYVMVYIGGSPIGSFGSGAVARYAGVGPAIGGSALLLLLFTFWIFRRQPALSAR
jgi:predicted MFS family arabinose efflux permease